MQTLHLAIVDGLKQPAATGPTAFTWVSLCLTSKPHRTALWLLPGPRPERRGNSGCRMASTRGVARWLTDDLEQQVSVLARFLVLLLYVETRRVRLAGGLNPFGMRRAISVRGPWTDA